MSIHDRKENGTLKLKILEGIPVSFPAIQVMGLSVERNKEYFGVAVVVVVVVVLVVVVVVVVVVFRFFLE